MFMNLMFYIDRMKYLLDDVLADERGVEWGHDVCTCSRFVHINTWKSCSDRDCVKKEVIPLLTRARDDVLAAREGGGGSCADKKKLTEYADNIETRIKNIANNYMQGKSSAFVPKDKISEWEAAAG